ncbi:phosphoadenosine phosphosulfate reductase family protein [Halorarius litoreus]|uniref:phosphoadenosine phosphosulfate reductase family protein n=1 Tax=Halorarius litoreus TaxID=2962676 RepID=UPI0020CFCFB2|nr:phosphoadenosine phosphosulfate reductase family protein [Halorarius litoreus]
MSTFPEYVSLDYDAGRGGAASDYPTLGEKFEQAVAVTREALDTYQNPAVLWTGGKDSTLVLYVVQQVCAEDGRAVPPVVFIDHFQHFDETIAFVERWADEWDLDLIMARNEAIAGLGMQPGESMPVADLPESVRRELARLDYEGDEFVLDADSMAGNHLLKTVAMNDLVEKEGYDALFSGVRWDEQAARATETFFSPRHDAAKYPPHDRVHPILQFDERAVWDGFWHYIVPDSVDGYPAGHVPESVDDLAGFEPTDLPVSPKYFEGYRSLGTREGSGTAADRPAWLRVGEGSEREGRAQDKEGLMAQLRDLGYM